MIALICNNIVADPYAMMTNNIFVTLLLLVALLVWLIELRKTDKPKGNCPTGSFLTAIRC